jgi:hypothetical protein
VEARWGDTLRCCGATTFPVSRHIFQRMELFRIRASRVERLLALNQAAGSVVISDATGPFLPFDPRSDAAVRPTERDIRALRSKIVSLRPTLPEVSIDFIRPNRRLSWKYDFLGIQSFISGGGILFES